MILTQAAPSWGWGVVVSVHNTAYLIEVITVMLCTVRATAAATPSTVTTVMTNTAAIAAAVARITCYGGGQFGSQHVGDFVGDKSLGTYNYEQVTSGFAGEKIMFLFQHSRVLLPVKLPHHYSKNLV